MPEPRQIDPNHSSARSFFRVAGPLVLLTGLAFTVVGVADGFSSFRPTLVWCPFVGMPLIFVGAVMTSLGFMGRMARYVAQEQAPVGVDTFNYAAQRTKGAVRDLAQAVGEGLRGDAPAGRSCTSCLNENDADAKFCSECGSALADARPCPKCRHENDLDAKFCDNCGQGLGGG